MRYVLLVLCVLATSVSANNGDWTLRRMAKERTDISTFSRPVADNPLHAFKGVTEVPHPPLHLLALMADIERMPAWVFQCHAATFLPQFGEDAAHIHIKGIWPVADRDAVTRTQISQDADRRIVLHTRNAHDIDYQLPGAVRIPLIDNRFVFEPLADGWTRVIFETQVDPGGKIPPWLANVVATRAPLVTLQGMHRMLADPRYHLADEAAFHAQYPDLPLIEGLHLTPLNP